MLTHPTAALHPEDQLLMNLGHTGKIGLKRLISQIQLTQLRGQAPPSITEAKFNQTVPGISTGAAISLLALQLTPTIFTGLAGTYPNPLEFAQMLARLLGGHADWLSPLKDDGFTPVKKGVAISGAGPFVSGLSPFMRLPHLGRLQALVAITLHERAQGQQPGQSAAAQVLRDEIGGGEPLKPQGLVQLQVSLGELNRDALDHLTDLIWSLHADMTANLQWREAFWKALSHRGPEPLEMRPPRTRQLPFTEQPRGVTRVLVRVLHPQLANEPQWTLPPFKVTRHLLGSWIVPDPHDAHETLQRVSGALTDTLTRLPSLRGSDSRNPGLLGHEALRDPDMALVVRLATSRTHGHDQLNQASPDQLAGLAVILTQLTTLACAEPWSEADRTLLTGRGIQPDWNARFETPPSAMSLAVGLTISVSHMSDYSTPERLHLYIIALKAHQRLLETQPEDLAAPIWHISGVQKPSPAVVSVLNGLLDSHD